MDADRNELAGADILVVDGRIESVAAGGPEDPAGLEVIDATGCVVTPALVNTHHHLFQTLTRAVPACQDASLFGWLRSLYPVWTRMRPEDVFAAARLGLAELARSGCGTTSDHHYIYPDGVRLEDIWDVSGLGAAGAWDPVAALILCGPFTVRDLLVEGRLVVREGMLTTVDPVAVAEAARRCVARLAA